MKLEYFVLLPIDICCRLQSFTAIALKTKKLTENLSQLNALVLMTGPPQCVAILPGQIKMAVTNKVPTKT